MGGWGGRYPPPPERTVSEEIIVNQAQSRYNDFGQLIAQYQAHGGAVNTSTTPNVEYAYADGSANTIRPTSFWENLKSITAIFADSSCGKNGLPEFALQSLGFVFRVVKRPTGADGFVMLPKRWIAERTFAWLAFSRRHSQDYERTRKRARR